MARRTNQEPHQALTRIFRFHYQMQADVKGLQLSNADHTKRRSVPRLCLQRGLRDAALGLLHRVPGDERQQHRGHRDDHERPAPARRRACRSFAGSAMQHGTGRMALRAGSGFALSSGRNPAAAAGRHATVQSLNVMVSLCQLGEGRLAQGIVLNTSSHKRWRSPRTPATSWPSDMPAPMAICTSAATNARWCGLKKSPIRLNTCRGMVNQSLCQPPQVLNQVSIIST